jgi:CBS domain containing-hemolysin-like protein
LVYNYKKRRRIRWVFISIIWTFFLAILFGLITHYLISEVGSIFLSFLILLFVVAIGIVFDLIGTAAAAAKIAPLNAKAARRTYGAKKGVYLVKSADQVANFCNDVIGDISGIVSGTIAAIIVYKLVVIFPTDRAEFFIGILLTAVVAAVTVGGKAWGKVLAIKYSTEIILFTGLVITRLENPFGWGKKAVTMRGNDDERID